MANKNRGLIDALADISERIEGADRETIERAIAVLGADVRISGTDTEILQRAAYLGDGVYTWHDGWQRWIGTSDGLRITNRIALDLPVLGALLMAINPKQKENEENSARREIINNFD